MQNLIDAEARLRRMIRQMLLDPDADHKKQADLIAGDVAAQVYHYFRAVAHAEIAIKHASIDK